MRLYNDGWQVVILLCNMVHGRVCVGFHVIVHVIVQCCSSVDLLGVGLLLGLRKG